MINKEDYRKDIDRLKRFMASKRSTVVRQMTREMEAAAEARDYTEAARIRDRIKSIESLALSGDVRENVQPEVFYIDPTKGLEKLAELLGLESPPRCLEGIDIANIMGAETVGSLVCFVQRPSFLWKPGQASPILDRCSGRHAPPPAVWLRNVPRLWRGCKA